MIAWLQGEVRSRTGEAVILDVNGVGYLVSVPLSTLAALPDHGADAGLHIHTHLREDTLSLYGFSTELEKDLFQMLIGVSGIGPKLALSVLSGLSAQDLVNAIGTADDARLCAIPGIGKKTAGRLCLELKDKIRLLAPVQASAGAAAQIAGPLEDAVSALVNLGYKRQPAEDAVKKTLQHHPDMRLEGVIREALSLLMKH